MAQAAERVTFDGADGWEIAATLHAPAGPAPGAPGAAGAPGVVLVHMLGRDRTSWDALGAALAREGIFALAIDVRGHGESLRRRGEERRFKEFGPEDWAGVPRDVLAALRWLGGRPGVRRERLGLAGASIGANAALIAAAEEPLVRAAALLSPGLDYRGLKPLEAIPGYGARPLLLVSGGDEDGYSRKTVEALRAKKADSAVRTVPGGGHGTEVLGKDAAAARAVADFFRRNLLESQEDEKKRRSAQDG